jgi:hypothetical protein
VLNRAGAASQPLSGRKTGAPKHPRPDETAGYCCAASRLANEAVGTEDRPRPAVKAGANGATPCHLSPLVVPRACHSRRSWLVPGGQSRTTPRRARPAPFPAVAGNGPARSGSASRRSMGEALHRPCRARPADPVPGRGGPERRRRPRPDGIGKPNPGPRWGRTAPEPHGQPRLLTDSDTRHRPGLALLGDVPAAGVGVAGALPRSEPGPSAQPLG